MVRWVDAGLVQFGVTAACFGFVSDVLELSDKYRQYFGPIRYVIAGLMKFVSLPQYSFELEYFPLTGEKTKQNDALLSSRFISKFLLKSVYSSVLYFYV